MKIQFYKILSIVLFLSGIYLLINTEVNITGAVIGISKVNSNIIGLSLIIASLVNYVLSSSKERKNYLHSLEDELENPHPPKIKLFDTVEEGLENTSEGELFRVKLNPKDKIGGYFMKVKTKTEAADIAEYLVGSGSESLRRLRGMRYKNLEQIKECTSTDMETLKDKAKKYGLHKFVSERVGFGKGEMKTKSGGKIFKRVARYDPPHKLEKQDIPFQHYNIEGRDFKKGLHILVEKD